MDVMVLFLHFLQCVRILFPSFCLYFGPCCSAFGCCVCPFFFFLSFLLLLFLVPAHWTQLLAGEIRRERNVILQCIRYIVQTDFFAKPDAEPG